MSQEKYLPALAVLLPLALFCAGSRMAYRDAERAAAARLAEVTRAMEEHAERAFAANDIVLREIARFRGRGPARHELLEAVRRRLPHIQSIAIGRRSSDEHAFVVRSGPLELTLEPAYFAEFYGRLATAGDGMAFRIAGTDGRVLAQVGALTMRYTASRTVDSYPVVVTASQTAEAALAPWRRRTVVLGAIALPSGLALLYVSLLVSRRSRRLHEESRSRARAEERLRHSQKMDALGELTGGVAHDFTNLMTVISNAAHVLREKGAAEGNELASILRAVDSGTRLTRQLLNFARRQPLNPESVELQRALPEMQELLKSTVGSGVSLGIHVAPDAPAVRVDAAELEMALINLAANARDAMQRCGELEILARAAESGGYAIVSVSDTGAGIPPELLARIFDPFFTTKPAGQGTGLGLAQVYGFCEQAGGRVEVESDVGVGTTVSLFLPAAATMSEAVARERRACGAQTA
jgi:signal transduction histidine kinase